MELQPKCQTCGRPHRPDLPCWTGAYRKMLCEQTYREQGRWCVQCRRIGVRTRATTIDHIISRAYGGGDEPRNREPLCRRCNSVKGARARLPYDDAEPVAGNGHLISKRFR